MDVILLEKVANLGNLGDRVQVRSGYARNFLLPQGKATLATPNNVKKFEERRAELEKVARDALQGAEARKAKLEGFKLLITAKAGNEGKHRARSHARSDTHDGLSYNSWTFLRSSVVAASPSRAESSRPRTTKRLGAGPT